MAEKKFSIDFESIKRVKICEDFFTENEKKAEDSVINFIDNVDQFGDWTIQEPIGQFNVLVFDVEFVGDYLVWGFYSPNAKMSLYLVCNKNNGKKFYQYIQTCLQQLLLKLKFDFPPNTILKNISVNQKEANKITCLVGHNILFYDLPILKSFLMSSYDLWCKNLTELNVAIIQGDWTKRWRFKVDNWSAVVEGLTNSNFFIIDTLDSITSSQQESTQSCNLFVLKTELFFSQPIEIPPLEYEFHSPLKWGDINHLIKYNFNDLFYTAVLFFCKEGKKRLSARALFAFCFDLEDISFASALTTSDSQIHTVYIARLAMVNRALNWLQVKNLKRNLGFGQLTMLHDYKYFNQYKQAFAQLNLLNDEDCKQLNLTIPFKNNYIKGGKGGLHTLNFKQKPQNSFWGSQVVVFNKTASQEYCMINIDIQSYYIHLLIQLWEKKDSSSKELELLTYFNQTRLQLKKQKDPRNIAFKIASLAYSGSLNYYKSPIYYPELYYSMTINGQMILLELLHLIENIVVDLIEVNTDGLIVLLKQKNLCLLHELLDQFETDFHFTVDTREEISMGFFFSSNQKLYCDFNDNWVVKGFGEALDFKIKVPVLKELLKSFTDIKSDKDLFDSIVNAYNKTVIENDNVEDTNLELWLKVVSYNKSKIIYYFSNQPQFCNGLPLYAPNGIRTPYRISTKGFPISFENFYNDFGTRKDLLHHLKNNLDYYSYFVYIINYLESLFFSKNINALNSITENSERSVVFLNNYLRWWGNHDEIDKWFFKSKMGKMLKHFYNLKMCVYFKQEGKKSFKIKDFNKNEMLDLYDNQDFSTFAKTLFAKKPLVFIKSQTLCVDLKKSFNNGIVCIDFDDPLLLFKNFGDEKNKQYIHFLTFINQLAESGFLIMSSPTNIGISRFKAFFKIKKQSSEFEFNYSNFKKKLASFSFLPFQCEAEANIFGFHSHVQSIGMKEKDFINLLEIEEQEFFAKLECFRENETAITQDQMNNALNFDSQVGTLVNLLKSIVSPPSLLQQLVYTKLPEGEKKVCRINDNNIVFFDSNLLRKLQECMYHHHIPDQSALFCKHDIGYVTIVDESINALLTSEKTVETQLNYADKKSLGSNGKLLSKTKIAKKKQTTTLNLANQYAPDVNLLSLCNPLMFKTYNTTWNEENVVWNDQSIGFYENLFTQINALFGTQWKKSESEESEEPDSTKKNAIKFVSPCIFDEDGDNRVTTAFIDEYGYCNIYCHHYKCQSSYKYKKMENLINSNIYCLVDTFQPYPFQIIKGTIQDVFDLISEESPKNDTI